MGATNTGGFNQLWSQGAWVDHSPFHVEDVSIQAPGCCEKFRGMEANWQLEALLLSSTFLNSEVYRATIFSFI